MRFDEINDLPDRDVRVRAYQEFTARWPRHSLAWHNCAQDLYDAGRVVEARSAALRAVQIDPPLRSKLRHIVELARFQLQEELVATPAHVMYRAVATDQRPVLLRHLRDRPRGCAERLFAEHHAATCDRDAPHLARPLDLVVDRDDAIYQAIEHVEGEPVSTWWHPVGGGRAVADARLVVASVARVLATLRQAGVETFDLRPEFLLRDRNGRVWVLGPLARPNAMAWLAPEERAGAAGGVAADVLRLGLLLYASSGQPVPTPDLHGARQFDLPSRWVRDGVLLDVVRRATAVAADERYDLEHLADVLTRGATGSKEVAAGTRVGGVDLHRQLGRGRFAEVWLGEDHAAKQYAVKLLVRGADSGDARLRFQQEAEVGAKVRHPGVVEVIRAGSMGDHPPYFVMELVAGGNLAERLAQGPLTVEESVGLGIDVADAMASVHDAGIVHRDLTPWNLLLGASPDGALTVKVADFSVARFDTPAEAGQPLTEVGEKIGTPGYMAPEQAFTLKVDHRADVWSLGAVLHHCLTGAPPDPLKTMTASGAPASRARVIGDVGTLSGATEVPRALAGLIEKMLAVDPTHRVQDMRMVGEALRAWRARATLRLTIAPVSDALPHESAGADAAEIADDLRRPLEDVLGPACTLLPVASGAACGIYRLTLATDEVRAPGCGGVQLWFHPPGARELVVLDARFHANPRVVIGIEAGSAATTRLGHLASRLAVEAVLGQMAQCLHAATIAPGPGEGDEALASVNRSLTKLRRLRREVLADWTGNEARLRRAELVSLDRDLRAAEYAARDRCGGLVNELEAVPGRVTIFGEMARTVERRVREIVERYRRTEAVGFAAWLGRIAVTRLAASLGVEARDVHDRRSGVSERIDPDFGHVLFELRHPPQERLRADRARTARFVDHVRERAKAFRMWWPIVFRDRSYEERVRTTLLATADAAERSARAGFDLLERHVDAGAGRPRLEVQLVVDVVDGELRRAAFVDLACPAGD